VSRARYTSPIPPLPSGERISYGPRREPGDSGKMGRLYFAAPGIHGRLQTTMLIATDWSGRRDSNPARPESLTSRVSGEHRQKAMPAGFFRGPPFLSYLLLKSIVAVGFRT
jgi:hypothetical protein